MSKNTVTLLDKLLAIPVAIYFWCYEQRQKLMRRATKKASQPVIKCTRLRCSPECVQHVSRVGRDK